MPSASLNHPVQPSPAREWLSLKEAVGLGYGGYSTLRQRIARRELQAYKIGGLVKVRLADLEAMVRPARGEASFEDEQPSTLPLDDETRNRLSEIEKTLAAVAAQLSSSEAVKLPDGSSVKRSDLDAHSMMTRIENQLATTTASSSELAEAVKRRGRVVIDTDKLTAHAITVLDDRLARAVEPVAERVEQGLVGFEQKVASVGSTQVEEAMRQLAAVEDKADKVVKAVRSAEGLVEALSARVTWTAVGRLALALLPLAAVLLMIGGLVGGVAYAAGFGPLLGWAWGSFTAADVWWVKALIAVGTLAGVATFGWVVWQLALKLGDDFRHW